MLCIQALFAAVVIKVIGGVADASTSYLGVEDEGNGIAGPARKMPSFSEFVQEHSREYASDPAEFKRRKEIYEARVQVATEHNRNEDRLWTAHPNHHWDRDEHELKALSGWKRMDIGGLGHGPSSFMQGDVGTEPNQAVYRVDDLPEEHNWKDLGAMQPDRVRSQACGNCWAAATTAMLESHMELHMGWVEARVPETEITECSANPFKCGGSGGCGGSTPELALQHTMVNGLHGLIIPGRSGANETSLSETSSKKEKCPSGAKEIVNMQEPAPHEAISGIRKTPEGSLARSFGMLGWERLPENRHEPILRALVERGPAAVAVSTDWTSGGISLSQYSSGIFNGCREDATISHSVLAIGYGFAKHKTKDEKAKYWLLQNSWGKGFGENGHFRLLRTDASTDHCGTDKEPLLGVGCTGGVSNVKVCGMCGVIYDTVTPHFEANTERSKKMLSMRELSSKQATAPSVSANGGTGFTESQAHTASSNLNDVALLEVDAERKKTAADELGRFRLRAKREFRSGSGSLQTS